MNERRDKGSLQRFFSDNGISVDPEMTAWCAAFVNAVLGANGIKGTGKLNAKSFLGFGQEVNGQPRVGDIVILNRGKNSAEGHVGFFQGYDAKGNVKVLGGNQRDGVNTQSFKRDDVVGIRRAPSQGDIAQKQYKDAEALLKKQEDYDKAIADENDRRRLSTTYLAQQQGLIGETLLAEQRRQEVAEAVLRAQQKAGKDGLTFTDEQRAAVEQTTGALFDQVHAQDLLNARRKAVDQPVEDYGAIRDALQQQITFLNENGQSGLADQLLPQLDEVNAKFTDAIAKAQAFYAALSPEELSGLGLTAQQIDAIQLKLQTATQAGQQFGFIMGLAKTSIAQAFAGAAVSAIDRFSQQIAEGRNAISALKDAFLSFAADFLRQIAQMILQQLIFNAISRMLAGFGGGGGGAGVYGGTLGGIYHEGGIVGAGGAPTRLVDTAWFQGAMRFHTGGIAGLRPDEVPAILQRGEEVLTADDPRHRANGGGAGGDTNIKNVVVFDPADVLAQSLDTRVGEKAFVTFVRRNRGAIKEALGG